MADKEINKINKTLKSLESELKKQNSLLFNFTKGIIYGLGFILGTTIVLSLLIALISQFVDLVPFINSFFGIDPQTLQEVLEKQGIETIPTN